MNDNILNILIIGGTRYHGFYTLNRLLREGFRVITISRNKFEKINSNHTHLNFNRNNTDNILSIIKKIKFHTIIDNCCYEPNQIKPLLEEIRRSGATYIFASSVMAYLEDIENSPEIELFPNKKKYKSVRPNIKKFGYSESEINYGINKRLCEDHIRINLNRYSILRMHNVIDINDFTNKSYNLLRWLMNSGENYRDSFLQVAEKKDVYDAIKKCMNEIDSSGIINIAKPKIRIPYLVNKLSDQFKLIDWKMAIKKSPIPLDVIMKIDSDISEYKNAQNYINLFKNIYNEKNI